MLPFELQRVQKNVETATTDDLLNRITAYRDGMEPEALEIIADELRRRGVGWETIHSHDQQAREVTLLDDQGVALKCSFCHAPAVAEGWGWHWIWGRLPVFPRWFRYCREHAPEANSENEES